jgi:hypothetical protein
MNLHQTDALRAVQHARLHEPDTAPDDELHLVRCIQPHQINRLADSEDVTVTYPPGSETVLSVQPNGTALLVPLGTQGPYERARLKPDRLVFAPQGSDGHAYLLPYTDQIPND